VVRARFPSSPVDPELDPVAGAPELIDAIEPAELIDAVDVGSLLSLASLELVGSGGFADIAGGIALLPVGAGGFRRH
jgi:hypothetical protein